ncbi:HAMP domain-containing histidine kinase (plasmid) [Clostridium estertheticum]|uniref:HAMP domain-containing sensor histidine kinase n=1 Tax=Clostridium estertheticum TaxID=238834 RepID=UPI001C0D4A4D|nr:HAMP domain-containing sensor histidine kinase [Clostridium estertheticum]MBU3217424.1 HAMP domain-containing histidine kinase [Clostridium estertheticum]WAG58197.1 HAMP domain-containing histidine kinase [Clostridium estertheticum]
MKKKPTMRFTRRFVPQIIFQSFLLIFTAMAAYMHMTWIVRDVIKIKDIYESAAYETLGTFVALVIVSLTTNIAIYNRRLNEVKTLSQGIQKIVEGDFNTKITIRKKDPMIEVYENFNKMSEELQSIQMLKNDFINNYSHEFKTPIASINGFASLLLEKDLSREEQTKYLEIIVEESSRLSNLASSTMLLSKLKTQQIVTDVEVYSLSDQLKQCSIILSKQWLEKKIEFSGDFPPVMFRGNKELMQHLWLNLLGNAIKFTPIGGEISAVLTEDKENIRIKIADTGEGIKEEALERLFDPYYQGDSSHAGQGLGLGLSIVKRIVELCDGSIYVTSELGTGSEFVVILPQ